MEQTNFGRDYDQTKSVRPPIIFQMLKKYIRKNDSIMEIGAGAGSNLKYLFDSGYHNLTALDVNKKQLNLIKNPKIKIINKAIQEFSPDKKYDVVFSSSVLYLIPDEDCDVFERISKMVNKYLITIEGEVTTPPEIIGRDWNKIFCSLGFDEVEHITNVFNSCGHFRAFKKIWNK